MPKGTRQWRALGRGGASIRREDAAIPIAWEDRLEAGFTEEELQELAEISAGGPSRETLAEVARILRDRFKARRAAEAKAGEGAS